MADKDDSLKKKFQGRAGEAAMFANPDDVDEDNNDSWVHTSDSPAAKLWRGEIGWTGDKNPDYAPPPSKVGPPAPPAPPPDQDLNAAAKADVGQAATTPAPPSADDLGLKPATSKPSASDAVTDAGNRFRPPPPPDLSKIGASNADTPDGQVGDVLGKFQTYLASLDTLRPKDKADFDEQIKTIKDDYDDAKSTVEKQELAHTIADGLMKLGAGLAGSRSHVDMTGVKLDPHDFQKDIQLLQEEMKVKLADTRHAEDEAKAEDRFNKDVGLKKAGLGVEAAKAMSDMQHQRNEEQIGKQRLAVDMYGHQVNAARDAQQAAYQDQMLAHQSKLLEINMMEHGEARDAKADEEWQKTKQTAATHAASVLANYKTMGMNPEAAGAAIEQDLAPIMRTQADRKKLHDSIYTPTFWATIGFGDGKKLADTDKISSVMSNLISDAQRPKPTFLQDTNGNRWMVSDTDPDAAAKIRKAVDSKQYTLVK